MSSHPTVYFGPAVLCEPIKTEEEYELYACFNKSCSKFRDDDVDADDTFCAKCGGTLETRTQKKVESVNPWDIVEENELKLQNVPWYQDKDCDYYIDPEIAGEAITIDCDYEESENVLSLEEIERQFNEFKVTYAKDIAALNAIYKGKIKVELVLLNWIH